MFAISSSAFRKRCFRRFNRPSLATRCIRSKSANVAGSFDRADGEVLPHRHPSLDEAIALRMVLGHRDAHPAKGHFNCIYH